MYIVALGWIYVVLMMSLAEQSAVAGVLTFLLYGLLPVTIILYLSGSARRRKRRQGKDTRQAEPTRPWNEEGPEA